MPLSERDLLIPIEHRTRSTERSHAHRPSASTVTLRDDLRVEVAVGRRTSPALKFGSEADARCARDRSHLEHTTAPPGSRHAAHVVNAPRDARPKTGPFDVDDARRAELDALRASYAVWIDSSREIGVSISLCRRVIDDVVVRERLLDQPA